MDFFTLYILFYRDGRMKQNRKWAGIALLLISISFVTFFLFKTQELLFSSSSRNSDFEIDYETLEINRSYFPDNPDRGIEINLNFPIFSNVEEDSFVMHIQSQTMEELCMGNDCQIFADNLIDGFKEKITDEPDWEQGYMGYGIEEIDYHAQVKYCHYGLLSIGIYKYEYTGGAHGMATIQFYNYDLSSQKQLLLEDLFYGSYKEIIEEIATRTLKAQHDLNADASLTEAGFFVDTLQLTENFHLSDTHIRFIYNTYEIAPYYMGETEITIPYNEIRSWIPDSSPLKRIMLR